MSLRSTRCGMVQPLRGTVSSLHNFRRRYQQPDYRAAHVPQSGHGMTLASDLKALFDASPSPANKAIVARRMRPVTLWHRATARGRCPLCGGERTLSERIATSQFDPSESWAAFHVAAARWFQCRRVSSMGHGVLLVFGAPRKHRLLMGREHGRTIPLTDKA